MSERERERKGACAFYLLHGAGLDKGGMEDKSNPCNRPTASTVMFHALALGLFLDYKVELLNGQQLPLEVPHPEEDTSTLLQISDTFEEAVDMLQSRLARRINLYSHSRRG